MWITNVRNKRRRANAPPKKLEAMVPGLNCLLLKNKTPIQRPGSKLGLVTGLGIFSRKFVFKLSKVGSYGQVTPPLACSVIYWLACDRKLDGT